MSKRSLLLLFEKDWDRAALARLATDFQFHYAGFDPMRPVGMWRLPGFDPPRAARALARRFRAGALDGVLSNHEGYGALTAALLARELGLPGHDPAAVALAQHKFHCREALARVLPEAVPPFALLPARLTARDPPPIELPCFVKPVKANFSILARRVEHAAELAAHVRRPWPERWLLELLNRPYARACRQFTGLGACSGRFIAEGVLEGRQLNVDGYAHQGTPHILGVVDEVLYPGTHAFLRFDLPARLPDAVAQRAGALAAQVVRALGLAHGMFNVELVWHAPSDRLSVLEVNPRMASQFADLYRAVTGDDLHAIACALACGDDPALLPTVAPVAGVGASFVFRRFDGGGPRPASAEATRARIRAALPRASAQLYFKPRWLRALEYRWLQSHRYAVVNLVAPDRAALRHDFQTLCAASGWPEVWAEAE